MQQESFPVDETLCTRRPSWGLAQRRGRSPVVLLPHQLVEQCHEPQVVNVLHDSAILDDRLESLSWIKPSRCNLHHPIGAFALDPRSWRCATCVLPATALVSDPWNQPRNRIACSDVAGCLIHPDFVAEIALSATCRPDRSSVHG